MDTIEGMRSVAAEWRPVACADYVKAQRHASALHDWATLLFLNNVWRDPRVVLEAPCDEAGVLPGIWRARCVNGADRGPCHLLRMWIMVAGHPESDW